MPVLNALKQVGAGVGATRVSIDNVDVGGGGCACWLDDDRLIFNGQDMDGLWKLLAYSQRTKATSVVDPRGANFLVAQLGRCAAQAGALYASFPFKPGAVMSLRITDGRGAFGIDGSIALCTDANCQAFDVYRPDGTSWHVDAVAYNLQVLGAGQAIWDGGVIGYEVKCKVGMSRRRVVTMPDGDYIVGYVGNVGLCAIKNAVDETAGRILTRDPAPAYHHDARAFGSELLVCWSTSPSEAPGTNVVVDAMTFPIEPLIPTVTYPVYDFGHPVLVAPFKAEGSGVADLFSYGIYSEAATPPVVPEGTRLLLAHDGVDEWTVPHGLRSCDMVLRELYLLPEETVDQSFVRWERQTRKVLQEWSGDVGVIPMFYDQQRWTVQQILDGLSCLQDVVNISPRIKMIAPFAYDRANGIVKYPELQRSFDDLCAAWHLAGDAALAPFPTPPDPPKPKPDPIPLLEVVHMEPQNVAVIGANGLFASVDPNSKQLTFDRKDAGPWETWSLAPVDGDGRKRYTLTPSSATDHAIGVDTTQYGSNDIRKLFYLKPKSEGLGNYEQFEVRKDPLTGLFIAYIAYVDQGVQTKPYAAPNLTVVPL